MDKNTTNGVEEDIRDVAFPQKSPRENEMPNASHCMIERLLVPATTNDRHQEYDSVYHVYNRIAHSVRFLDKEEKDDLLDRLRRASEFCGVRLISWCIMTNHFHVLVYLPSPREMTRAELVKRLELLRPEERAVFYNGFILDRAPRNVAKRMFSIGMFMKIVKENFTLAYNDRTGHHGTMWEGPYRFKKVPMDVKNLSRSAAYQNVNPIRANMADAYDAYSWTSFAAASRGDRLALSGLDFIFGGYENRTNVSDTSVHHADRGDSSDESGRSAELLEAMRNAMDESLSSHRCELAVAIWRKRIAGDEPKMTDPLTTEAMVAQVQEKMERMQSDAFREKLAGIVGRGIKDDELKVVRAMAADPMAKATDLAKITGASISRIKRISLLLQKFGIIRREGTKRVSAWRVQVDV